MQPDYSMYIMQFFSYDHLPPHLREVSKPFGDLADQVYSRYLDYCETSEGWPETAVTQETDVALRKLLESKDAAVRAALVVTEIEKARKELPDEAN